MELFWIILTVLGFIVWNAKARITDLELRIQELELRISSLNKNSKETTKQDIAVEPKQSEPIAPIIIEPAIILKEEEPSENRLDSSVDAWQERKKLEEIRTKKFISTETPDHSYSIQIQKDLVLPEWIMRSLTGGRLFVTLGLLLLFIGVAMLFKYVAHYIEFPIEARFVSIGIAAIGMIAFGGKQIGKRRDYGLYLQGGGLGLLFMTVFSAFKFYDLLPPDIAFALLVLIGAATFALSLKNNSMALSVLAVTGGFLAPLLTSTGHGSHIALFSYYLLINLIIFAIAWNKSWRVLNSIGFGFTFVIGLFWGGQYYRPELYNSVQLFLIIYFLLYTGIGILFASRYQPNITDPIDVSSIFGTPLIGFGLQLALVKYFPNGEMISSLVLGGFYSLLFVAFRNNERAGWKLLSEIFMWFALLFFTLAIPFGFSAQTTGTLWAMEGVALLKMFQRTKKPLYSYAGILVLSISNIFMLTILDTQGSGTPFLNGFFAAGIIMAVTHFLASHILFSTKSSNENIEVPTLFSVFAMFWWFGTGFAEIKYALESLPFIMAWLVFFATSALAGIFIFEKVAIPLLDKLITLVLPAILFVAGLQVMFATSPYHPAMEYGYLGFPIAFAAHYFWLKHSAYRDQAWHHIVAYITIVLLAGFELGHQLYQASTIERDFGWLLAALFGTLALLIPANYNLGDLSILSKRYQQQTGLPLIGWAFFLCIYTFTKSGIIYGHYIPILNIVDMLEMLTIVVFVGFYRRANLGNEQKQLLATISGGIAFTFITCFLLRIVSYNIGVRYLSDYMFDSIIIQTSLTILWTLIAMTAMIVSSKKSIRNGWFLGATLLGFVVLKLFIIDLAGTGTLSRIVSFMGVGGLTLLLGYISPMPPKESANAKT